MTRLRVRRLREACRTTCFACPWHSGVPYAYKPRLPPEVAQRCRALHDILTTIEYRSRRWQQNARRSTIWTPTLILTPTVLLHKHNSPSLMDHWRVTMSQTHSFLASEAM